MTVSTGDDQFNAMIATLPEPPLKGADDLYCGHLTKTGLSWLRWACPICSPKAPPPACESCDD